MKAKKYIEKLPYPIGRFISYIPFKRIFGESFVKFNREIENYEKLSVKSREQVIFSKMKAITDYAYRNIPFYRSFYNKKGFNPSQLEKFSDINKIPIVKKSDLRSFELDERSSNKQAVGKINTGGTTGEPLEFFIEKGSLAREWSHMLYIWQRLNYRRTDLKLTFRGKNIGKKIYKYNPVNNEYLVNTYADMEQICNELLKLIKSRKIRFLHGYPSTIYEFAKYAELQHPDLVDKLNYSLKGILFGSEYPAPIYRDVINRVFSCNDISWYGHSEMCILAGENVEKWVYEPFHTYGYCEAIPDGNGSYHLLGTSYHNTASPFIRYDTGDLVKPVDYEDGILSAFKIDKGRVGEFIKDNNGRQISLTSLIFGRHHPIFGHVRFIQVEQKFRGKATILVTPEKGKDMTEEEIQSQFDSTNIDIDFTYKKIEEPVRGASGKIPLLVQNRKN